MNWIDNTVNGQGIHVIMKMLHVGDFIEFVHSDSGDLYGGYVTTLTSDAPATAQGQNKTYVVGISTKHSSHNDHETVVWASQIKSFRVIHKGHH